MKSAEILGLTPGPLDPQMLATSGCIEPKAAFEKIVVVMSAYNAAIDNEARGRLGLARGSG